MPAYEEPPVLPGEFLLYPFEFVIFEFQLITHVDAEGQQGNGNFGDNAGVVVLDEGVVTADINYSTKHKDPP